MNKSIIAITLTTLLAGCGEPSEYEQQKELMLLKQNHELLMEREKAKQIAAEKQVSNTYIENEYETEYNGGYNNAIPNEIQDTAYSSSSDHSASNVSSNESGFSGGEMLLAAGAGALAGYAASEMLSNGMQQVTDSNGNVRYIDTKTKKEVSKEQYETAKKTSKVTTLKEKSKELANKAKDKTKAVVEKAKPKAKALKEKAQYQARKAKVLTKKAAKKAKRKIKGRR
ncbi:hypothetical protein KGV31_002151 [Vibrio parahaemolyticus]|nr:hypothetical protein [Vibrio parahaemolyticus]EHU0344294.1 hypothetical protein [Vibrio parahaemolyticus]EHU0354328.1 hypothetical protein [Vibrio parahaemolyticus]